MRGTERMWKIVKERVTIIGTGGNEGAGKNDDRS